MAKTATRTIEGLERRIQPARELRAQDDGGNTVQLQGYAAVINMLSEDLGGFKERIAPGAFAPALERGRNTVFLVNHEDLPLAALGSQDLELEEDETGLFFRAQLEKEDPDVDRIIRKVKPGKLDKMSFGFTVKEDTWDEVDGEVIRTILEFDEIWDVSIVTFPAYPDTTVAMRGLERVRDRRGTGVDTLRRELDLTADRARMEGLLEPQA